VSGSLGVTEWTERRSRAGTLRVPVAVAWVPAEDARGVEHRLDVWEHTRTPENAPEDASAFEKRPGAYMLSCDVAGGEANTFSEGDYHAIKVFDWHTRM